MEVSVWFHVLLYHPRFSFASLQVYLLKGSENHRTILWKGVGWLGVKWNRGLYYLHTYFQRNGISSFPGGHFYFFRSYALQLAQTGSTLPTAPHGTSPTFNYTLPHMYTHKNQKNLWTKSNTDTISDFHPHSSPPPADWCYGQPLPTGTICLGPHGKAGCKSQHSSNNCVWAERGTTGCVL